MVQFRPSKSLASQQLPTELDLPDTDNRPVDNELQLLLPILLRSILELAWGNRSDWFFGSNMGLYYDPKRPAVGPDGFLSLGVPYYRLRCSLPLPNMDTLRHSNPLSFLNALRCLRI
ncbi:hypothetical protein [Leptolyngbya sp. BC1307]|uniref:hypothetical protein n=1 Tax=Leptolyngbya sp. BC1307 TaxID=2029589 RepID=UPI000EFC8FE7|nr:hypothetical protein [Leptolyngbya sp. BC1307]